MTLQDSKKIRTSTLLRRLYKAPDVQSFFSDNAELMREPPFHAYLSGLCRAMGQVPERIIRQASIERTYGHQLFNGTRKPSRDKVIQLAFGFGLDVADAQKLLAAARKSPLYPKIKRDAAVLYCLSHHRNILETQDILNDLGLTLLGGD
jgi:hypothetical protein